jgi:hypothetical protein
VVAALRVPKRDAQRAAESANAPDRAFEYLAGYDPSALRNRLLAFEQPDLRSIAAFDALGLERARAGTNFITGDIARGGRTARTRWNQVAFERLRVQPRQPDGVQPRVRRHALDVPGIPVIRKYSVRPEVCSAGAGSSPLGVGQANGSESKDACKQFSQDYMAIKQAGWKDPSVGAIHWFGVLGEDSVQIGESEVTAVVPIEQPDGSGFYVSPTALADADAFPDPKDQRRYIDAETIPAAVIRNSKALFDHGVKLATFGVAMHRTIKKAVPFIVGDYGPRIGEGTFALGRLVQGLPLVEATRKNIYSAHVEEKDGYSSGQRRCRRPITKRRSLPKRSTDSRHGAVSPGS